MKDKGKFRWGLRSDEWIEYMVANHAMIDPFEADQVKEDVISFGLSSYGYDIRITDKFKIFHNLISGIVDPKNFDTANFIEKSGSYVDIPPNSFALGYSVEYIRMPRDVLGIILGKSTYARCGIVTNFTPLEPEWEGHITIEISNTTPLPARIYANEGIAQIIFFQSPDVCRVSYADKRGKYNKAQGLQLPKI